MSKSSISSEIQENVSQIVKGMDIAEGSPLAGIVDSFTRTLIDIASRQYMELVKVRDLTGIKLSRINTDDIKQINPEEFDNPKSIAKAMNEVLKIEAEKLLLTSDFIGQIKENLNDCSLSTRASFDAAHSTNQAIVPIKMARTIAGKCIKSGISIFGSHNQDGLKLSISHMPDVHLRQEIQPLVDRVKPFLN